MRRCFPLALALALLSLPPSLAAQPAASLHGQVTAATSGLPVAGARITFDAVPPAPPPEFSGDSDLFGLFNITSLPPGDFFLRVEHPAYHPFETNVVVLAASAQSHRVVLTPLDAEPWFDVQVHVAGVTTGLPLAGVPVNLRRYVAAGDPNPSEERTLHTDADGFGVFRGLRRGEFSFDANLANGLPRWEPFPATPRQFLDRPHAASFRLKPVPGQLSVQVVGLDAVTETITPLPQVFVELTGLDPRDSVSVLVPTMSGTTEDRGEATFPGLPAVSYRISAKRLGYHSFEEIVPASRLDNPAPHVISLDHDFRSLRVVLRSPYLKTDFLQGVPVRLQGLTNSNTQGIDRILTTGETAEHRDFANLLPGRYLLTVRATTTNVLHGVAPFFRAEDYVDVFSPAEEAQLDLEVQPALIQGRLYAADSVGSAAGEGDPTGRLGLRPVYRERQAADIELIEYSEDACLPPTNRVFKVNANELGEFAIPVVPARYGIRVLSLSDYWGSHVVHRQVTAAADQPLPAPPTVPGPDELPGQGWPYAETWPFPGRPPRNFTGADGEPLTLSSGDHQLDLFVHRHQATLLGTLGSGALASPTARVLIARQADPYIELYADYSDLVHGGGIAEVRNTDTGETRTFAIEDDGANISDLYLLEGLHAGNYELRFNHPRFQIRAGANTLIPFAVPAWNPPGVLPGSDPSRPPFVPPLVPSPLPVFAFPTATAIPSTTSLEWEIYIWNEDLETPEYELDEFTNATIDFIQPDFAGGLVFAGGSDLPIGGFTYWVRVAGGAIYEGRVQSEGASVVQSIYMGGPDETPTSDGPPERGYSLTYRAVSRDDRGSLIPGVQLDFHSDDPDVPPLRLITDRVDRTVTGHRTTPELIKEIFPDVLPPVVTDPSGRWEWQVRYETNRIGPIQLVRTNGLCELTIVDPSIPRLALTVPMVLRQPIDLTGTLQTDTSTNAPAGNKFQLRDRFGAILAEAEAGPDGQVNTGTFPASVAQSAGPWYIDGCAPGFKPFRARLEPTNQTEQVTVTLEPVEPPVIMSAELDRFGLYMPGVRRFGNQSALSAFTEDGPLTLTWTLTVREQEITTTLTTFDRDDGSPGTSTTQTAPDPIREVWFVNAVRFADHPYSEPGIPIPPPTDPSDPRAVSDWLDRIRYGSLGWVYHQRVDQVVAGTSPDEKIATGKVRLWRLPPGEVRPVFVVISQHGAVRIHDDYEFPSAAHVLKGVAQPRWLSFAQEIMGFTAGVQATADRLSGIQPLGRFQALPSFTADIEAKDDGFLQYLYGLEVSWTEAMQTPDSDFLVLAPPDLGLKVTGGMEFGLNVRTNGQLHLSVSAGAGLNDIDVSSLLPRRVRNLLLGNSEIVAHFNANGTTTRFAAVNPAGTDFELGVEHDLRGGFGFDAEVDLSPVTSLLPVIGPSLKLLSDTELFETFATLKSEVELVSLRSWQTVWPAHIDTESGTDPDRRPLRRDAFGGNETEVSERSALCLCFNFSAGLRVSAFENRLGASGEIALEDPLQPIECDGFPRFCTHPSLVATLNPDGDWPLIKRIQGGVNLNLEAHADLWITRLGWEFSLNLFPIDFPLGTDPRFDLLPMTSVTRIQTPASFGPATFAGASADLVSNFLPMGSFDAQPASAEAGLLYADTDPSTGRMILQFSRRGPGGTWLSPTPVTTAPGLLSPALTALPSGGWLAVWSEIDDLGSGSAFPASTLRFATRPEGGNWSAPTTLAALTDVGFDLQLISAGPVTHLVFLRSNRGPLASQHRLFGSTWDGTVWSEPRELVQGATATQVQIASVPQGTSISQRATLSADPAPGSIVVWDDGHGRLESLRWDGVESTDRQTIVTNLSGPFSIAASPSGQTAVAATLDRGALRLFTRSADRWEPGLEIPPAGTPPQAVELAHLEGQPQDVWLLAWVSGGSVGNVFATRIAADLGSAEPPVALTQDDSGSYRDLTFAGGDASASTLLARHSSDRDTLRVLSYPPRPPVSTGPRLTHPILNADGTFEFSLSGPADTLFSIEVSNDLRQWLRLTDATPSPEGVNVRDNRPPDGFPRFYRAVAR